MTETYEIECPACGGTGVIDAGLTSAKVCEVCKGNGKIVLFDPK